MAYPPPQTKLSGLMRFHLEFNSMADIKYNSARLLAILQISVGKVKFRWHFTYVSNEFLNIQEIE